jgi:hypothetical protein
MADAKISALPDSTLPLAGTEVLPIVQSGVTKKVANNDLRPKQIQSNATSGVLQVAGPASASTRVMTTPDANFSVARIDASQTFTGSQIFSAGTALLPAITTAGDTNTGVFFPAADTMAFTKNGAESMRIDSAGNVGIGKTNPIFPLDVNGRIGNGANQYFFTQTFPNWTGAQKIIIPITSNTLSNVTTVMVELDIVFAVVGTSDSQSGAGKFILEIRNNGAASPTLMGTITTVHARTIASSWIAYVATGNGTGQLEISNNGAGWNYASGLNRIGLNIFASNAGVTVGTITVV